MALPVQSPALNNAAASRTAMQVASVPAVKKAADPRVPVPAHQAVSKETGNETAKQDGEKFSFFDFLDIINPLQHIPIVNTVYRAITGDEIKGGTRVVGGALFGGPIGAILGGVNAVVASENKGKDIGELAMNKIGIGEKEETIAVAEVKKDVKKDEQAFALASNDKAKPVASTAWHVNEIIWDDEVKTTSLPKTKELSDLEPVAGLEKTSVSDAPVTPLATKAIPNEMMAALDKYRAMKNDDTLGLIQPKIPLPEKDKETKEDIAPVQVAVAENKQTPRIRHPYAGIDGIRRY